MSMYVRQLTIDELTEIQKLKASKTKPARQVQRAKIIWFSHQKTKVPQIATKVALCSASVRKWIRRFNQLGLSGLLDAPRHKTLRRWCTHRPSEILYSRNTWESDCTGSD